MEKETFKEEKTSAGGIGNSKPVPMSEEDIKEAQELLAEVARENVEGYFVVVKVVEIADGKEEVTAQSKVSNTNIATIMSTFPRALDLTEDLIIKGMLMSKFIKR